MNEQEFDRFADCLGLLYHVIQGPEYSFKELTADEAGNHHGYQEHQGQ